MFTIGSPSTYVTIPLPEGFEMFIAAIAAFSTLLIVRAIWRTLSGG